MVQCPLERVTGPLCSLLQTTSDNVCPCLFPGETPRGGCAFRLAWSACDISGPVPGAWPSHLHGGARTAWWGRRDGSQPVQLGTLYRGQVPFSPPASVCVAVPLGDAESGEGLAGTPVVTPCAETGVGRAPTLVPTEPSGLLCPDPWEHIAQRSRAGRAGAPCACPCWSTTGKGTATFPPPRLLRNTKQFPWDLCPFPPRMSCEQGFPCCHCVPPISS